MSNILKSIQRTGVHTAGGRSISKAYIAKTLEIYKSEYITLNRAEWDGTLLSGHFSPTEYPFTKPGHIGYVTTAMAALYLSQMGYLYTRLLIDDRSLAITPPIAIEHFFSARDNGDLVITKLSLKCRQKIPVTTDDLRIVLWRESLHRSPRHILCKFGFDFQWGSFAGDTIMAMPIPIP